MKVPSNYILMVPVVLLALLSLKYAALADSSNYDCQESNDLSCARDIMMKCIKFGTSYSNRCSALCHVALAKLNGNWETDKRAQRRKQNKNLSNVNAMQLLPMRKRDVSSADFSVNPLVAQALGLLKKKRDTYSLMDAAVEKRVDKTTAQQLGLLRKREAEFAAEDNDEHLDNGVRSVRAIETTSDACTLVIEEIAARLVSQPSFQDHD